MLVQGISFVFFFCILYNFFFSSPVSIRVMAFFSGRGGVAVYNSKVDVTNSDCAIRCFVTRLHLLHKNARFRLDERRAG